MTLAEIREADDRSKCFLHGQSSTDFENEWKKQKEAVVEEMEHLRVPEVVSEWQWTRCVLSTLVDGFDGTSLSIGGHFYEPLRE